MAWFTVNDRIPGLLVPLQQKRVRLALPQRARLTAADAMADHAEDAPVQPRRRDRRVDLHLHRGQPADTAAAWIQRIKPARSR